MIDLHTATIVMRYYVEDDEGERDGLLEVETENDEGEVDVVIHPRTPKAQAFSFTPEEA